MQSESEGIRKLSIGSLLLSAVAILMIVAPIAFQQVALSSLSNLIIAGTNSSTTLKSPTLISFIELSVLLLVISFAIMAIGNLYLSKGFAILARSGRKVGLGNIGAVGSFLASVLLIIGTLLSDVPIITALHSTDITAALKADIREVLSGLAIEVFGILIIFIGNILVALGLYKVGDAYDEGRIKMGGISVFLATILTGPLTLAGGYIFLASPILFYIGFISTYIGLRKKSRLALRISSARFTNLSSRARGN